MTLGNLCQALQCRATFTNASGINHHMVEKCTGVRQINIPDLIWKKFVLWTKDKKNYQDCSQQIQALWWYWSFTGALDKGHLHFCDANIKVVKDFWTTCAAFTATYFTGTCMHFWAALYKTTSCTNYKGMTDEEDRTGTRPARLQSWLVHNSDHVLLYFLRRVCTKNGK